MQPGAGIASAGKSISAGFKRAREKSDKKKDSLNTLDDLIATIGDDVKPEAKEKYTKIYDSVKDNDDPFGDFTKISSYEKDVNNYESPAEKRIAAAVSGVLLKNPGAAETVQSTEWKSKTFENKMADLGTWSNEADVKKAKTPSWKQSKSRAALKAGLRSGNVIIGKEWSEPAKYNPQNMEEALNAIMEAGDDPADYVEELKLYEPVTIIKDGKKQRILRRQLEAAQSQGYTLVGE